MSRAKLCTVLVTLGLLVALAGGGDRITAPPKECTPIPEDATCGNPKNCINACAARCDSYTSCAQCCQQFGNYPAAYQACLQHCRDVWPQ
jgi:hypothetical protein